LDFNPKGDNKVGTKVRMNGKPRRSSTVPREVPVVFRRMMYSRKRRKRKKTDVEKSEKPSKPKRQNSVSEVEVPELPVVTKPKRRK